MEVEARIRQSLEMTPGVAVSAWAQSLGRLVSLLADELAATSASADEALRATTHGATRLFQALQHAYDERFDSRETMAWDKRRETFAEAAADALCMKLVRASEITQRDRGRDFEEQPHWSRSDAMTGPLYAELVKLQDGLFLDDRTIATEAAWGEPVKATKPKGKSNAKKS